MRKLTPIAKIIEIFSTESLESCQQLLDAAETLVKNRRKAEAPTVPKRRAPRGPDTTSKEGSE
jgi:hypothetical protein